MLPLHRIPIHTKWRRAALARAKAASRLAERNPFPAATALAVECWEDAVRDHGEDAVLLSGLVNALLLHAEVTLTTAPAHRALALVDKLDALAPEDPRGLVLRGLALSAIGEAEKDADRLREAIPLFQRAQRMPNVVHVLVAGALAAEVAARMGLAELTGDPRDAAKAEERRALLASFAPGMGAGPDEA